MTAITGAASPPGFASATDTQTPGKAETFVITFAIAFTIVYTICVWRNWPLFTYHPAVKKFDLFWHPGRSGEGPAMHWYGWVVNSTIASAILGALATRLPENLTKRIWPGLVLFLPILAFIYLGYSLSGLFLR